MFRRDESSSNPGPPDKGLAKLQPYWNRMVANERMRLSDEHYEGYFKPRGISRRLCDVEHLCSTPDAQTTAYYLSNNSAQSPAWIAPYFEFDGETVGSITARLNEPRPNSEKTGKSRKFEHAKKAGRRVYIPLTSQKLLRDPSTSLVVITEGVAKTLSLVEQGYCALGLPGVTGWSKRQQARDSAGDDKRGARILCNDLLRIASMLTRPGMTVVICFDNDAATNESVRAEEKMLGSALCKLGATVAVVRLPREGDKVGVDDFLVQPDGPENFAKLLVEAMTTPERPKIDDLEEVAEHFRADPANPRLVYGYAGAFWQHSQELNRYSEMCEQRLKNMIRRWIRARFSGMTEWHVREVVHHLREMTELPDDVSRTGRGWVGQPPEGWEDRDLAECLYARNLTLHIPTGSTFMPTPDFFNTVALVVDYDPTAPKPEHWIPFVEQSYGDGLAYARLHEMLANMMIRDLRRPFLGMILGAGGSGKGVTSLTLIDMYGGVENVATPTLEAFGKQFALASAKGKSMIIISEANTPANGLCMDRLKRISAGPPDPVDFESKGVDGVSGMLNCGILITADRVPDLPDTTEAPLRRRLVVIETTGKPKYTDIDLRRKLRGELPGILNEIIEGWRRLRRQNGFTEVPRDEDELTIEDQIVENAIGSSSTFFAQHCVLVDVADERWWKRVKTVLGVYEDWAFAVNERAPTERGLIKLLQDTYRSKIKIVKKNEEGKPRWYELRGLAFKSEYEAAPKHVEEDGDMGCESVRAKALEAVEEEKSRRLGAKNT